MKNFVKEFKEFIQQGNMLEIAVGLLIGVAFNDVVTKFSDGFLMPPINHILGWSGESNSYFEIAGMQFAYGAFISSLISFIIIALVLFSIVKAYNTFIKKSQETKDVETELTVLKEIKDLLDKEKK